MLKRESRWSTFFSGAFSFFYEHFQCDFFDNNTNPVQCDFFDNNTNPVF